MTSKCTIRFDLFACTRLFFPLFLPLFSVYQSKWTREDFLQRRQQQVDGTVLKVDASFKFAKFVSVRAPGAAADTKPFHCVVTLFNEFEQASKFAEYWIDEALCVVTLCVSIPTLVRF